MSLSKTKFDGKIMIYIEFCINKNILKILGFLLGEQTPQNPNFKRVGRLTPLKRARVLGPSEEFSKKPMYVCSCAPGL